jgi:hypothetical protein
MNPQDQKQTAQKKGLLFEEGRGPIEMWLSTEYEAPFYEDAETLEMG